MQIKPLFVAMAVLATGAAAKLKYRAICLSMDYHVWNDLTYDKNATETACENYKNRNTGTNQWDSCPDCFMNYEWMQPFCDSQELHIGGNEWEEYCLDAGAKDVKTIGPGD